MSRQNALRQATMAELQGSGFEGSEFGPWATELLENRHAHEASAKRYAPRRSLDRGWWIAIEHPCGVDEVHEFGEAALSQGEPRVP